MKNNPFLQDLQKNIQNLLANSPAADVEKNLKSLLAQAFSKMDLVTRQEYDQQAASIRNLRDRIATLESKLNALEGAPQAGQEATKSDGTADRGAEISAGAAKDPSSKANF